MSEPKKEVPMWPLPPEWAGMVPPPPVKIVTERLSAEHGGVTGTRPVWNEQWLRGLEAYVRGIACDEMRKMIERESAIVAEMLNKGDPT